jgi:hypothetical protein
MKNKEYTVRRAEAHNGVELIKKYRPQVRVGHNSSKINKADELFEF